MSTLTIIEYQEDLALFLTEGDGEESDMFKISLPLIRWLVLRQLIPQKVHVIVNNIKRLSVSRENIYDSELYRIGSSVLQLPVSGIHSINGRNQYKYSDIVISSFKNPTVVLEYWQQQYGTSSMNILDELLISLNR
ncbi:2533_t:CDS:2 [Funneliformis geosporum]|uniref:12995_t:CDS:1 n=1 Tax=Funneliformis geosporum TaxID=1117311 RepID=A0A9W4SG31_9GLOM|nr:12995_t:CDS:2 [Funneliformis geosporum]CAI2178490.1 2533_t:CDS:2 [Funneliformis geosporum]